MEFVKPVRKRKAQIKYEVFYFSEIQTSDKLSCILIETHADNFFSLYFNNLATSISDDAVIALFVKDASILRTVCKKKKKMLKLRLSSYLTSSVVGASHRNRI